MSACFQELSLRRRVGIVTTRAGGGFHRVIRVRLFEPPLAGIMTGEAKGGLCLYEQVVLVGAVRMMANPASLLLKDGMYDFLLIRLFLMTLIACLRAFGFEEVPPLRGVRIMARGAFSGLQRRV